MQGLADSTIDVTYSKLPSRRLIQSTTAYGLNDGVAGDAIRLRSSHRHSSSADEPMPHLNDYGITRSPTSKDDVYREITSLFRNHFDDVSVGMCRSLLSLTPPESCNSSRRGSLERGSSSEDKLDLPDHDVLLVRIPRRPSDSAIKNQPRCDSENDDLQLGLNGSGGSRASPPHHGITINLLDKDLWKMFESVGNEMIVTKPGR
jgi:hypothetical protein